VLQIPSVAPIPYPYRSSFPHYLTPYGNVESSKSTPISPTAVSHTAFRVENGLLFALRAALLPNKIFKKIAEL